MRNILLLPLVAISVLLPALAISQPVFATDIFPICSSSASKTDVCKEIKSQDPNKNPVISTIKSVISVISFVIGTAAVIVIIISGLRMIVNGGDAKAVAQARSGIVYALVGLVVAIFAQAIVILVLKNF